METNRHNTIFYLHWIRESSANVADADLGTRVPAAQLDIALINLLPHQQSGKPWTLIRQKQIDEWVASPDFEHQLPHWAWRKLVHFFGRQPVAESVQIMRDMADRIRRSPHSG